jgi:hypothetical protein
MSKIKMIILMMAVFVFVTGSVWSAPRKVTKADLLTAADVTKVSGLTGAKLIAKNPAIGAGGDLNFATSDNKLIVMVQVVHIRNYAGYKQIAVKPVAIKGLGDQAIQGATSAYTPPNQVVYTKGNTCVALTVFGDPKNIGKNMLTMEQTIELAKIIAARMVDGASWDWGN